MQPHRAAATAILLIAALLSAIAFPGCGGSGTTTTPPTTTPANTPDMGTLTTVNDGVQLKFKNAASPQVLAISAQSQVAGTMVVQSADTGSPDQQWHAMPMPNAQYNIENLFTHQVLGITSASTAPGAIARQWADNSTSDHLWSFYLLADGNYLIKNANSNLFLQVDTTVAPTVIDQGHRTGTGCTCQEWILASSTTDPYPAPMPINGTGIYVHDPAMIQAADGTFWLYGSHNVMASSPDLINFTSRNPDFATDFPWWAAENTTAPGGRTDVWAPSPLYANQTYFQYYSIPIFTNPAVFGSNNGPEAVIALMTSPNPNGPWTDTGKIISSCGYTAGCTTGFNAIDPAPFIDPSGKWWMSFGSFYDGIYVLQLDPATGLRLAANPTLYNIARRGAGIEGSYIFPWIVNGTQYYYFFASINACCVGTASTYRIITGRSTSPTGPYLDRGGLDLMNGGGTILLSSHGNIYGPGGQGVIAVNNQPILLYHYYDGANHGTPTLGLNKLAFDSTAWPYVQ